MEYNMRKLVAFVCTCIALNGCITGPKEVARAEDFLVRRYARNEFPEAVKWAASLSGWKIVKVDDSSAIVERRDGYRSLIADIYLNGVAFISVRHKESNGYGFDGSFISSAASKLMYSIGQLVSDRINSMPLCVDKVAKKKGIDAKGVSRSYASDSRLRLKSLKRLETTATNEYAGAYARETIAEAKLIKEIEAHEAAEVHRGEEIIENGLSNQWKQIERFLDMNFPAGVSANIDESNYPKLVGEINTCFSSSNLVAQASFGGKECQDHAKRRMQCDTKTLRLFVSELKKRSGTNFAKYFLCEYKLRHFGEAGNADTLLHEVEQYEYDNSKEGQRAKRVAALVGAKPNVDFVSICRKLEGNDKPTYFQRKGLVAAGSTHEYQYLNRDSYYRDEERWKREGMPLSIRSKLHDRVQAQEWQITRDLQNHEKVEVSRGLQQALTMMKRTLRDELLNYVMMHIGNYENTEAEKDERYEAMLKGIALRGENIIKSFSQAYSGNPYRDTAVVYGSEYEMEEDKRSYLNTVAKEIAEGIINSKKYDVLSRMCKDDVFQKYFALGAADVAAIKNRIPEITVLPEGGEPKTVSGTGWFVNSNHVVTCYHVIEGRNNLACHFQNGIVENLSVVAFDKDSDTAILGLAEGGISHKWLRLQRRPGKLADKVCTFGYPLPSLLGQDLKYSEGSISSMSGIAGDTSTYQISVPLQPGNSGGALLNVRGEVVGITSSRLDAIKTAVITGGIPQNVNYAIKVRYLIALLDDNGIDYSASDEKKS